MSELFMLQMIDQMQSRQQQTQQSGPGRSLLVLWRIIASHVLLLLLGGLGVWYMNSEHDFLKSYTGCRPGPSYYSERTQPEPPPLPNDDPELVTNAQMIKNLADETFQLRLVIWNLNRDRDEIRRVCGR